MLEAMIFTNDASSKRSHKTQVFYGSASFWYYIRGAGIRPDGF